MTHTAFTPTAEESSADCMRAERDRDLHFWHALIDESKAADYLGLKPRTMQGLRQRGGGPRYIDISSRCVRYRRADLRDWADARVRKSTSDPGPSS